MIYSGILSMYLYLHLQFLWFWLKLQEYLNVLFRFNFYFIYELEIEIYLLLETCGGYFVTKTLNVTLYFKKTIANENCKNTFPSLSSSQYLFGDKEWRYVHVPWNSQVMVATKITLKKEEKYVYGIFLLYFFKIRFTYTRHLEVIYKYQSPENIE